MFFKRNGQAGAEKLFILAYNSYSTATLTNGQAVQWDHQTDANGVGVTRPTARATSGGIDFAGIVAEDIASGAYGWMQIYGYHSAVRVRQDTSSPAANIAAGSPLALNTAGSVFCLEATRTASTVILVQQVGFALAAQASWTTKAIACFIKGL
jgi:hypothetical protein